MENPSCVDHAKDKEYKDKLIEKELFICQDCKHEKPLKEQCKGRAGAICGECFDERIKSYGCLQKAIDSITWGC